MRERKKTAVHGTLALTYKAVKFNFQPVLPKTLISTMNTLKDMAVLNLDKYSNTLSAVVCIGDAQSKLHRR